MLRIVLFIALLVVWIWALVDVIITPNGTFRRGDRTIWLLVVLFAGTIGALIYVGVGRPRRGEIGYC